jgi:carbamoyl-phosphate synthase large subunit
MRGLKIAVSGLHRGENPQPGAAIVAGIRQAWPDAVVVGLVYNAYESGIYAPDGPLVCHAMPYPTAGLATYLARLAEVRAAAEFDWLIPTLDAEITMLAGAEAELARLGIRVALPGRELLATCGKAHLSALARDCGVHTPETAVARDLAEALVHAERMGYPVFVKGHYYDAALAGSPEALKTAGTLLLADWGPPLLVQEPVAGAEFNVMGLGDGQGGMFGHCAVRKLLITDKGKGNGSVVVSDPRLEEITARVLRHTSWHGPFELEFVRDTRDDSYCLIEINPRFPAWVGFATLLGANYPAAWVECMVTGSCRKLPVLEPGMFFMRHQVEVCGRMDQIAGLLAEQAQPQPLAHSHAI